MSPETLALFLRPAFAWSLLLGAFAALWAFSEHRVAARAGRRSWIDPGAAASLAAFVALALLRHDRLPGPAAGALLIGLGLALAQRLDPRRPLLTGALLAFPGAALLAATGRPEVPAGAQGAEAALDLVLLAAAPAGALAARSAAQLGPGPALLGLALSAVGVFYTVPDTEEALLFLGVALPCLPLACLRAPPALGPFGAGAWTGALAWLAATGARGRPPVALAGLACLGLLLVTPLLALVARRLARDWPGTHRRELAGGQLLLVFVAARLIPRSSLAVALLGETTWLIAAGVGLVWLAPRAPSAPRAAGSAP